MAVDLWQRFADGWHDALLAFDRDLRVVAANAPAAALFGVVPDQITGRRLREIDAVAADVLDPLAARAFDEETVFSSDLRPFSSADTYTVMTHRLLHDDATIAFTLHREADGNWPTDTGWAHRELAFANRLLKAYTDHTSLGFVRWDREWRVVEWSPRAAEIFGWTFDEVRGRSPAELGLVFPGDAPVVATRFNELVSGAVRANISENRNLTKDGRVLNCRWFNSRIEIDGAFQIVSLIDDVTDLIRTRASALESEQRFRSLFEQSPDAMLALSLEGVITRANAAAARSHGTSVEQLVGRDATDLLASADALMVNAAFRRASRGTATTIDVVAVRADESTFPVLVTMIPIVFEDQITGVHLLARDLTAIRRAERDVAAQSDRLRELYLVAASANATAENLIAATIDAGCRLLGMTAGTLYDAEADRGVATVGEPIPRRLVRLALATDGPLAIEDLRGIPYLGEAELAERPVHAYLGTLVEIGGVLYGSLCFAAYEPRTEPFSASDRDLVQLMGALVGSAIERGRARARLKHLAYNDQLTALPNRAWFSERLRDELVLAAESHTRVAVMFLDLDRFKDINDTLGHALGDRMLRSIGDRLTNVVGGDGLVARMGGDEFIVLVANDPSTQLLERLAHRIISAIDQPLVMDGYEQFVTTSIGIAVFPSDGDDADALIKHADVAMYRAKERGRNTHQFFTPALGASLRTRISQEKSLRKALEREEFLLHFQPQFEISGDRLVAFEALVRWQHPRLGLIGPDHFIPSAEMSGLIVGLGDWVLQTACRHIRRWQSIVPELRVAVNLSARQFHQTALAAKIADVLSSTGVRPNHLEIEITESVAMSDAALSVQILEELGATGVRIAVDDFGTGYSSLGYLRRFALDSLKIDKSFVHDLTLQPDDATIVRTVIGMAHSLGMEVCAEGVETNEQLAFLRHERCDRVQGFLLGRPMAADEVDALLARRGNPAAVG